MTARALSFLRGYWRQWWHCYQLSHGPRTAYVNDRINLLACWDCRLVFWQRPLLTDGQPKRRPFFGRRSA